MTNWEYPVDAPMLNGKLSDKLRPNSEAAPWVVEEVKKLEDELAEARRDAERYRWLQSQARLSDDWDVYGGGGLWQIGIHTNDSRLSFDAAIDAAREE